MAAAKKIDAELSNSKPVTDKVTSIAHETVDKAAEHAGSAEEAIRETVSNTADTVAESKELAALEISSAANKARKVVVDNPLVATGVAFTMGFLVTSLMSKKS